MRAINLKSIFFPEKKTEKKQVAEELNSDEFERFVEEVLTIPEEQFYLYALQGDPLYGKMDSELKKKLIQDAINCGVEYAQDSLKRTSNIYNLLKKEEINFSKPFMPNGGGYVIFAQYTEPNNITVFEDSIKRFVKLMSKTKDSHLFSDEKITELLTAHEYFHYLEYQNEATIVTKTKKIELWKIFNYRYQSKFISLSEMSAMSFAKEYLSLSFSPFVLDCLLTYSYNTEMSREIYNQIVKAKM